MEEGVIRSDAHETAQRGTMHGASDSPGEERFEPRLRGWPARVARCAPAMAMAAFAGCTPYVAAPAAPAPAEPAEAHVYRCEDGYRFSVRFDTDRVVVRLGAGEAEEFVLPRAVSASGARYAARGMTYWSNGREALLETPAASYRDCVGQPVRTQADEARLLAGEGPTGIPVEGAEWRLVSVEAVPTLAGDEGTLPGLRFLPDAGRVVGSTGCNRITGGYVGEGDRLSFAPLATTRRACVDAHLADQERRFLAALARVDGVHVWGDVLTLLAGAEVVARFVADGADDGG